MRLRQQFIRPGKYIPDRHTRFVFVFARPFHIAVDINGIDISVNNGENFHQICVLKLKLRRMFQIFVVNIHDNMLFTLDNSLHLNLLRVSSGDNSPRVFNHRMEIMFVFELINRRPFHIAGNADERAGYRHKNHVPGLEDDVLGLVAFQQKIVEVERGYQLVVAPQLNTPHRSDIGRSAHHHQRVRNRSERADRVSARFADITQHKDGNRLQRAHGNVDIRPHNLLGLRDQMLGHLLKSHSGDEHRPHLRNRDLAVPIHRQVVLGVEAPP